MRARFAVVRSCVREGAVYSVHANSTYDEAFCRFSLRLSQSFRLLSPAAALRRMVNRTIQDNSVRWRAAAAGCGCAGAAKWGVGGVGEDLGECRQAGSWGVGSGNGAAGGVVWRLSVYGVQGFERSSTG